MSDVVDMDLSFEELAMLFALKGWLHGSDRKAGIPDADALAVHIGEMVNGLESLKDDQRILFNSSGRFTVHTDPEMPDSYEIHLYVGNIDRQKLGASS